MKILKCPESGARAAKIFGRQRPFYIRIHSRLHALFFSELRLSPWRRRLLIIFIQVEGKVIQNYKAAIHGKIVTGHTLPQGAATDPGYPPSKLLKTRA
jgi:hypothetical protein